MRLIERFATPQVFLAPMAGVTDAAYRLIMREHGAQLAYTEMYVTDLYWPDFNRWEYLRAIRAFQGRGRRYGGVVNA